LSRPVDTRNTGTGFRRVAEGLPGPVPIKMTCILSGGVSGLNRRRGDDEGEKGDGRE
jgi:hypothetical protein